MSALCYNKGCGQQFEPDNNPDNGCIFHPGVPVFHDALKGWSCCDSKTTDFSDFLNIAGCTKGHHNKEKPPEPVKPIATLSGDKKDDHKCYEYIVSAPKPLLIRPSGDEPMVRLQNKIFPSLKQALEKLKLSDNTVQKKEEDSGEIKIGTACQNGGCTKSFEGPGSNGEACSYHAGCPVFHEGMKYWSCCKSKTSDFNTFLSQEGCTTGTHIWRKKDTGKKVVPCRFDWHQTGSQVTVSIYAKNSNPDLSYVEVNSIALNVHIVFEGEKEFEQNIKLWGVIDVSNSVVNMMSAKIEIVMKKSEPVSWAHLYLKEDNEEGKEEGND